MNIYVINPRYLKTDTFHSLCEMLKVSYIYNLIEDEYIDSYLSGSECKIDFNIRKLKKINENSWKQGVYAFLDRVSIPIFENQSLVGRELKTEMIDLEHSNCNPVRNILYSNAVNVLVLQDHIVVTHDSDRIIMYISENDFVDYAQKIILKYTNIGKNIRNAIVGVCIDEFLFPKYRRAFLYVPVFYKSGKIHHSEWLMNNLRNKQTKKVMHPMDGFIFNSFKKKLYSDREYDRKMLKELLSEEGYKALTKWIRNYRDDLREEQEYWERKWQDEQDAADAEWRYRDTMNEFRSMMDDCDAWGNID